MCVKGCGYEMKIDIEKVSDVKKFSHFNLSLFIAVHLTHSQFPCRAHCMQRHNVQDMWSNCQNGYEEGENENLLYNLLLNLKIF